MGGDGTFENPFGEVTAGVAISQSAGNDVIYVDGGTNPGLNGFIIPDQVRVLSTGVVQSLDIADVGQVQLPGSGTGTLPRLDGATITNGGFTGQVAMGNNRQLSGFNVITTGVNQRGILGLTLPGLKARGFLAHRVHLPRIPCEVLHRGGSLPKRYFRCAPP